MNAPLVNPEPVARIGRYVLAGSLGMGGMGEVYKARIYAAAGVEKDVCVKRIRRERLEKRDTVERFIEEARLSMTLTHGNIVQVFDFGRAADEYFLAMEWVDGADLGRVLERARDSGEPLDPVVAVHVAACIASALAYAHAPPAGGRPVIHCDLKPANVLISRSGEVKLADFGAAATLGADIRAGTKGYMAPERANSSGADARVDLYSLGVVLVEMLSGTRPPHDEASLARVPADLRPLADRLLAADPSARTIDANEAAEALEGWVSRARAAGAVVPSKDLARRATAAAAALDLALVRQPASFDTEACFSRDGRDERAFRERMTATTGPVTHDVPAPAEEGPSKARRAPFAVLAVLAVLAIVSVAAVAVWLLGGRMRDMPSVHRSVATAPPTVSAPSPSAAPAAPVARPTVAVPESPTREGAAVRDSEPTQVVVTDAHSTSRPVRAQPATLDIHAAPWATVSIDGRSMGESPLFGVPVSAGRHVLVLSNPDLGATRTMRLELAPGEHRRVVVRLEPESPAAETP